MSNKTILIVLLGVGIVVGGYFFLVKNPQSSTTTPTPPAVPLQEQSQTPPVTAPSPSETLPSTNQNVVTYTDSGYSPNTLTIPAGTTVTFKNESARAMWTASAVHPSHRVYGGTSLEEHCPDTAGTAFDTCSGTQPGNSWSFTFTKKGVWKYHNHLSPADTGTIVVEE